MLHSFDIKDAEKYGVHAAVILNNLRFWITKNVANNKHWYEGEFWTYNSVKAFSDLFPYLTADQIRRALSKLEADDVIKSGNFNNKNYDRTKWYAICGFSQMDLASVPNGIGKIPKPIPDSKPDSKPDTNSSIIIDYEENGMSVGVNELDEDDFGMWWYAYPRQYKRASAKMAYFAARRKTDAVTLLKAAEIYAQENYGVEKKFIKAPENWLREMLWEDNAPPPMNLYEINGQQIRMTAEEAEGQVNAKLIGEI